MKYVQIKIKGKICIDWSEWFNGLEILNLNGDSLLLGFVVDMSEAYGVIEKVKSLGVEIISFNCVDL